MEPDQDDQLSSEALERRRVYERARLRRRTLVALTSLAIVAFLIFLASFTYEDARLAEEGRLDTAVAPPPPAEPAAVEPPEEPLYTYLPSSITGYHTKALQNTPYGRGLEAEAIYEPEDMILQLASPLNVYARLTVWATEDAAREHIANTARGFPLEALSRAVGPQFAVITAGYSPDRSRYFVGHHTGRFSVIMYATYTRGGVPYDHGDMLRVHGEQVAESVVPFLSKGVDGAE